MDWLLLELMARDMQRQRLRRADVLTAAAGADGSERRGWRLMSASWLVRLARRLDPAVLGPAGS
jgi:hypothetical protein